MKSSREQVRLSLTNNLNVKAYVSFYDDKMLKQVQHDRQRVGQVLPDK